MDLRFSNSAMQTGGAINITLCDDMGKSLRLGKKGNALCNWLGKRREEGLSIDEKFNRNLLAEVLMKVGFVCNPNQWWHWSYGDQEWGMATNSNLAIYGDVAIARATS